ncbi:unnamed protein product [Rotaria sp. Silwood1]|nr:unnamed protein product [Rotaria sp. Silwood1]CAF1069295.1 unnamed protein product [Rotaria sp. Silwood1]CAF3400553.1 unnamed protein product [Rotaria sp. Silwood1]CAF3449680.1 unnamed protein product [Rotaria sp. Silwood1]CAF4529119.1 unnamed protein product [Rotaria sp. Silwood1]
MNNIQALKNARRVFQIRQSAIPTAVVRFQSDSAFGDRPWDKSTRAVVDELPDVISPADIKSRHLPGTDSHSPQVFEPKTDKNIVKGRTAGAHFDLRCQNWERNQNQDFRSRMKQWDMNQQAFKTSRLIKYQEYGTFESNRGNISGRPGLSNSTPSTLHHLAQSKSTSTAGADHKGLTKSVDQAAIQPPATSH